ncbi:MAG: pyridoxamine 5'-phosphate oxidase family protein [Pararhodobacter sp.]|nr:pyridoxamine 5'-phosphate oxidase family protein [Pararhodobacter sp.]
MTWITELDALEALYPEPPSQAAIAKVARCLTPAYRAWIDRPRFCMLAPVGPQGTDCSPRGDDGPVVSVLDPTTLALPDWRGNNRLDSLRNIVADGRVSLTFMVAGAQEILRVNGNARLSVAPDLLARFNRAGRQPRCVVVVALGEVYMQCAKSLMRSRLWQDGDQSAGLPSLGTILQEGTAGGIDAVAFDTAAPIRARERMW